jgi:FkbM family methyltransferase
MLIHLLLAVAPVLGVGWCVSSCKRGMKHPVPLAMRNLSAEVCPAQSHGLYKLHADLTQDPKLSPGMDLAGNAGPDCRALDPALPPTWLCVYPPEQDAIISKGIIWRGHWSSDCNEEYRLRTLCAIVRAVRKSGVPHHRAWVLDIGSNIGTFTLPLLAAGVNVVSIEADADNLALLNGSLSAQRRLAASNSQTLGTSVLVGGALAATEGMELCMERASKHNSGSVQFRDAGLAKMEGAASPTGCSRLVRTTTLDAALERTAGLQLGGPDGAVFIAMKMDVQGAVNPSPPIQRHTPLLSPDSHARGPSRRPPAELRSMHAQRPSCHPPPLACPHRTPGASAPRAWPPRSAL